MLKKYGKNLEYKKFKIKFLEKAYKDFKKIDVSHQKIIKEKILILAKNPKILKNNIKKLSGIKENIYRLRSGNYRIIFKKDNKNLIIIIIRIGHRKDVYFD